MKPHTLCLDNCISFSQFKNAVIDGDATFVSHYLSQIGCQISDPLEDQGYPDADGYNSTITHSLLYEAVPHLEVLKILLKDGRFNPNEAHKDAFYRCLNSGSIEGLKLFFNDDRFSFPEDALIKAVNLGGQELVLFLLTLDAEYSLFSQEVKERALDIASTYNNSDQIILETMQEFMVANNYRPL